MGATYSVRDAARILRVSPSRLRYWQRTDLLSASSDREDDSLAFRDLVCVKALLTLLQRGVPLRRIRASVEILRAHVPELDEPLSALRLWSEGSRRVVIRHHGMLLEPEGQMVLDFGSASNPEGEGSGVASLAEQRLEQAAAGLRDAESVTAYDWFELGCKLDSDPSTLEQALAAYRNALELDPDFADAHCNLGAVLYNQGRRAAARRAFERCIELDPTHVEAHFNVANLLEEDGLDDLALSHYQTALERDPMYGDLHVNLALLYEKMGRRQQARTHWQRYLHVDRAGPWAEVARRRLGL